MAAGLLLGWQDEQGNQESCPSLPAPLGSCFPFPACSRLGSLSGLRRLSCVTQGLWEPGREMAGGLHLLLALTGDGGNG